MKKNWKITFVLLAICCVSVIAAFIVGISGNPPGLLLCYLASVFLILAFVYSWRKLKNFVILLAGSITGFFLFVILHNAFYAFAEMTKGIIILTGLFEFLHAVFFIIATLVCPAGFLLGAAGSAAMSFKIGLTSTKMSRKTGLVFLGILCVAMIVAFFVFISYNYRS